MRGRHVTPLEADTCDDGDFQEVHHGWKMGHEGHQVKEMVMILRMDIWIDSSRKLVPFHETSRFVV